MLKYMASEEFDPKVKVSTEFLTKYI
jgi:hypothetical protein